MSVGPQKAWSVTAGSNASADANINWAENQLGPTVNNSARATMAAIKGAWNQISGGCTYGGSSNAYTMTSDPVAAIDTAYATGMIFMFKANHTNNGAATLNVDGVGAVAIKTSDGGDVASGDIVSNGLYMVAYNATGPRFDLIGTFASGSFQPLEATLTAFAAVSFSTTNQFLRATDADIFTAESASAHRTALGLGTLATASSINNSNWSGTALAVANGGTGSTSASDARTALGVTAANIGLGNVENKSSATIRGELTSGNVTTALTYTPYNATNPNNYITIASVSGSYQPIDAQLTALAASSTITGTFTLSASDPSGGSDGDIWFKYV